jgi:hypothetical protein
MKHLLSSTAFIVLNKELAKQVGINAAILLADLISKEEYFIANGMTDGWFFNTENNIELDTTLNSYHQRTSLKILKDFKLIEVKRRGIPAKQYFKINENQVMQILTNLSCKNSTTSYAKNEQQVIQNLNNKSFKNCTTINKNNNKNKEIIIINKYFNKPSLLEIKNYCVERVNNVDPEAFFDFYESKGWLVGKSKMKDWKAAIRTWERTETKKEKPTISKLDWQINEWQKAKKLL